MSLIQKQTQTLTRPLYTIGAKQTFLIIGLGNPGKKYIKTRHNIGFECLDYFAKKYEFPAWTTKSQLKCQMAINTLEDTRVILIKPTTYMNLSGESIAAALNFFELSLKDTLIVHDDIDVKFGQLKIRLGGGSAGHNGLKSIISRTGKEFYRLRVGVGPKLPAEIDSADFVLGKFTAAEQKKLKDISSEAATLIAEFAYSGGQLPHTTTSA